MITITGFDSESSINRCIDFMLDHEIKYTIFNDRSLEIETSNLRTCHYRLSDNTFIMYTLDDMYIISLDNIQEVILT